MNRGGWIPLCKALSHELPHDRPFNRIEAMFSLTMDYDQGKTVTVKGYASLWQWSQGKVKRFFEEIGAAILYPENTGQRQNQRGEIVIQITERKRRDNREIKIIDSKWLSGETERKELDNGEKTERSQVPTKDPDPDPDPKTKTHSPSDDDGGGPFTEFWKAYPRKVKKLDAQKAWKKIKQPSAMLSAILSALEWQKISDDWTRENGKCIPHPTTYLNQRRWEDEKPEDFKPSSQIPLEEKKKLPGRCPKCGNGSIPKEDYRECKSCGHKFRGV